MSALDETSSEFFVHSNETAETVDRDEESYRQDESYEDDCADEYESEFDEAEQTSPQPHTQSPAPPIAFATPQTAPEAQTDEPVTADVQEVQRVQVTAEPDAASSSVAEPTKPRAVLSRLPVWVGASKQATSPPPAPTSAPVSRLSTKPPPASVAEPTSVAPVLQPVAAWIGSAVSAAAALSHAVSRVKAVPSSAPTSKPPSRSDIKSTSSASIASRSCFSSTPASSSSSPTASKPPSRSAAFIKPNKSALSSSSSSSSSPAHKSSPANRSAKPAFDFTTHKSTTPPTTSTLRSIEASTALLSLDSKPLSPRVAQLQREARWDPTPFIPPVVPQFATLHTKASQPLLDVKQSAWQLQKARRLPSAPNVLLRKPRSEVVTRMSDVVMRTRQLRRRTKGTAAGGGVAGSGKGEKLERMAVEEKDGEHGDQAYEDEAGVEVPALRLAVGEQVEQRNERRTRHNSPLAKSRMTGNR